MQYNIIMWENSKGQSDFLFKQPQQQTTTQNQQLNNKTQATNYHNFLINMEDNIQNIPRHHHHHISEDPLNIQTNLIKIQPTNQSSIQNYELSNEDFILRTSQTSERSALETTKTYKDLDSEIQNKSSTKFELDQASQQEEQSPQSSLRKLYKIAKNDITDNFTKPEQKQRLIKLEIIESQSKFYQQNDEEQQEQDQSENKYKMLKSNTLYDLITFPVLKNKMIKCLVRITHNRFLSLQRVFDLYLYNQKRHLLRARKKKFRFSTYFEILGKDKNVVEQFAQVKSNFTRTQYKLIQFKKNAQFSERSSEKSQRAIESPFNSQIIRITPVFTEQQQIIEKQDCYLSYEPNFLGLTQQKLILLKSNKKVKKSDRFSDLKNCYQNCEQGRFKKFTTRLAQKRFDGKLTLDFKQEHIEDSSKNMIIQDQFGEAGLMFAKIKDGLYVLNVMHPFNILQAFFLALCNLDTKIFNR